MTSATVRRVTAAGIRMRVFDEGEGPAALVLHGFTGRAESMQVVADAALGHRRVIRPDLVGHGESDAPAAATAYAMSACVEQLIELLDRLGVDRVDLVGYSMGGRTALTLAVTAPGRVRSLVLIGATAGLASDAEREARVAADEALAARILEDGVEAFVDHWMALPLFASQVRLGEASLVAARRERNRCRAEGLAGSLRGMGTGAMAPLHGSLAGLNAPVLLVVGEEDVKFRGIARDLSNALPDARIAILPEAGHAAHLENPSAFAECLAAFWSHTTATPNDTSPDERRPRTRSRATETSG